MLSSGIVKTADADLVRWEGDRRFKFHDSRYFNRRRRVLLGALPRAGDVRKSVNAGARMGK
jgi:hypothetical protein